MVFRGCIFDLDGVITNTAKYHFLAWKRLADHLGIPFTQEDNEGIKGVSRMKSLESILQMGNHQASDDEKLELTTLKNSWFIEYLNNMSNDEILPGVVEFLDDLDNHNVRKAIGSASKNAGLALEKIKLVDRFDKVIDGTMVTNPKPDPEVFLRAAQAIDLDPKDCLVFEDAAAGIEAAHNGKMKCIGIGKVEILHEADAVIGSFEHINWQSVQQMVS